MEGAETAVKLRSDCFLCEQDVEEVFTGEAELSTEMSSSPK